jgi:glycosyltransferase involved in cell wall biosynthesis
MRRRRLILAANAAPGVGGQGLNLQHMIAGSRADFELSVFCLGPSPGIETQVVSESGVSKLINQVPLVRRRRDWTVRLAEVHFDNYVAARIPAADIFQGVTGQCWKSLRTASKRGCRTMLDVITTHVDDFGAQQDRECLKFGVRPSLHPRQREQIRQEYQAADVIRVMSETARKTFLARGFDPERVVVIQPPIDLAEFEPTNFSGPKFRVSFVGLLEPWKGFHYLIEAFNALNLEGSELVLWGGPGSRSVSRYLREQTARNPAIVVRPAEIRSLGFAEVYGKSSVLVHPSLADGFGLVVAEAMASGVPVIATSNTGAADLIEDGKNGYVVPPADSGAIRDRLAQLAGNPRLLRDLGQAARATISSLTFARFRERYVSCLQRLAA